MNAERKSLTRQTSQAAVETEALQPLRSPREHTSPGLLTARLLNLTDDRIIDVGIRKQDAATAADEIDSAASQSQSLHPVNPFMSESWEPGYQSGCGPPACAFPTCVLAALS